ncbi:MAG: AAA family ATPase [Ignavibacteriales bacterium]
MSEVKDDNIKRLSKILDVGENMLKKCIEGQQINVEELLDTLEKSGFTNEELQELFSIDSTNSFNPFIMLMTELKSSTTNMNKITKYFDDYNLRKQVLITYFGVANLIHQDKKMLMPILGPLLEKFDKSIISYIEKSNQGKSEHIINYSKKMVNILKFSADKTLETEYSCSIDYNRKVINNCYMRIFLDIVKPSKEDYDLLKYSELQLVHPTEKEDKKLFFEELELFQKVIFDKIIELVLTNFEANSLEVFELLDYFIFEWDDGLLVDEESIQTKIDAKKAPKESKKTEVKENITISYLNLEKMLKDKIIGQDIVIENIIQRLKIADFGVSKEAGAKAVFLLVGPTGVGKTEVVKMISKIIGNNEDNLIRIDMSEYKEEHTVSKLIGAPPGYVGYDDTGKTTVFDKIIDKPKAVILLDEIEKAHHEVLDIFLHVFDEGKAKTNKQKDVDFSNNLIFMTSNIGTSEVNKTPIGFEANKNNQNSKIYKKALEGYLRPEFINRIDEIIVFNSLSKEMIITIINNQIKNIENKINQTKNININIVLSDNAIEFLINKMEYTRYGAREVRRTIERYILNEIINLSINRTMNNGVLQIDAIENKLNYSYEEVKVLKMSNKQGSH